MRYHFAFLLFLSIAPLLAQNTDSSSAAGQHSGEQPLPVLIPPHMYVECGPITGGTENEPVTISVDEAMRLEVMFRREMLPPNSGVQFLTIEITQYHKDGTVANTAVKHAFTFPRGEQNISDRERLKFYARQIVPYGFVSERKIERVTILNDTVPEWSLIKVEVSPDDEYTKFAERLRYKIEWWYRIRGGRIEEEFFLGIPKVLYDSRSNDTITYGNASAMLRFYLLDGETGERFPLNLGIGTFGVSTPIDVTKNGGGFAVSLLFDVVQAVRSVYGYSLGNKFNAGIELTPFFPVGRKSRILLNARIGYAL